ncbi:Neutral cholesterol ester hydrolase 1 [Holothuria leucospilota]|uniref:Neutral cholesterol ester hydrolase 1 n=1 Tax=Holothuria leucospilota TaxID=206669 RepID=A0A9Q1BQ00_HOLLE|nr:Neutral cholesterol ester hydrolase 1 [Holothuria leucospilota]
MALFSAMHLYGLDTTENIGNEFIENNHTSNDFRTSSLSKERLSHSLIPPEYRDVTIPLLLKYRQQQQRSQKYGRDDVFLDPRLSPLFKKDFSGLPTAYIATMEYDTLRDDGILYAKHLEHAGVDVTWCHYDNGFHGVVWISPGLIFEDGKKVMQDLYQFLKLRL